MLYYILTTLVALFLIIRITEPYFIYFPTKELWITPKQVGLEYKDIYLETKDKKKIHGWEVENPNSNKIILYFHGNGGNIADRVEIIKFFYNLPCSVFIIDYHGYGRSQGRPSEKNLYLDANAAYEYLITSKGYSSKELIIFGSSIGGSVATRLASQNPCGALVLQSTFTSARDMANRTFPFSGWIIASNYNSIDKIDKVSTPLLIIHSQDDEIVPYEMGVKLYNKAREPKQMLTLSKVGHNDYFHKIDSYRKTWKEVLID